jgi:hypothetical protein
MSEEKKVMCHVFLVSYHFGLGVGSLLNYREIGKCTARPTADDLDSMLDKICEKNGIKRDSCLVTSVSELQDQLVPLCMVTGYHEDTAKD